MVFGSSDMYLQASVYVFFFHSVFKYQMLKIVIMPMGRVPKRTTKVGTYFQTGSTLPTYKPSMDKKKFGQVLLLSTLPTYPKSLDIF